VFYTKWTREMKDGKDGREEKKEENGGKRVITLVYRV
jgi:hypothetical protein